MEYFISIFLGTFLLEDVALASALALVVENKMPIWGAFAACFLGISIGDLGLYFLGSLMGRLGMEDRFRSVRKFRATLINEKRSDFLTYSVIVSRVIPGTRLPTYLTAGLLRYPLWRFSILTVVTVFAWVSLAFAVGQSLKTVLMNHWLLTVLAILLILKIVKALVPKLSDYWERRALLHSWRKWGQFEFWPATLFYLPIVPYYVWLSLRHRNLLLPFYANPQIENGGLIGESKWDFLKHLSPSSPHTLKALKIDRQNDFTMARRLLDQAGFSYPFIIKPDVGQRGFGVRVIRDDFDLMEYLLLADFPMIVQSLSDLPREAGVFYVRLPAAHSGSLFSLTDKIFPTITGDGHSKFGDLILADKRARLIASTYFARHRERLNEVPAIGQTIALTECGNHCQGAIFRNGAGLITEKLARAIDQVAKPIPGFHFGRIDIRYKDADSLMNGEDFEIVEINGAGSEATHIWDERTTLFEAYGTLFRQWHLLFATGAAVKRSTERGSKVHLRKFLRESYRVFFRSESLSVSS